MASDLTHLVEGDILEDLDPGEEGAAAGDTVQEVAPVSDAGEVYELVSDQGDLLESWLQVKVKNSAAEDFVKEKKFLESSTDVPGL